MNDPQSSGPPASQPTDQNSSTTTPVGIPAQERPEEAQKTADPTTPDEVKKPDTSSGVPEKDASTTNSEKAETSTTSDSSQKEAPKTPDNTANYDTSKDSSDTEENNSISSSGQNTPPTVAQDDSVEGARLAKMVQLIEKTNAPEDLKERAQLMVKQGMSSIKYGQIAPLEQAEQYVNLVSKLPWGIRSQDNLDLKSVKQMLNKNHYGMDSLKERIIEYLAVLKLQQKRAQETGVEQAVSKAPIVCFVGLVGTGKTTVAYSIAEAMGRKFVRIPFGGMGSAADLRGQSRIHPDAEPGLVLKAYMQAGVMNPVILLDEIDRVTEAARADIMGVLVELLDPKQNVAFVDHYLDFPFNLSETIFIGTANNTKHIATAVMDRIEPLQMPSYSDKEKIVIGRDYVLPKQLANCGLTSAQLKIADDVWQKIVRPTGFDAGIRTLERTVNGICRKTAREIVEGRAQSITITEENLKKYIPQW